MKTVESVFKKRNALENVEYGWGKKEKKNCNKLNIFHELELKTLSKSSKKRKERLIFILVAQCVK